MACAMGWSPPPPAPWITRKRSSMFRLAALPQRAEATVNMKMQTMKKRFRPKRLAIVLPISGWLASLFGRKRFFIVCIFIFTVASALCGSAASLNMLLLFRVIQGAGGGGLQPMAQAILADTFPPEKRGVAFALYGITAIMAPTIGPTLGGWITDNYSWRWIFFINLPVGI